MKRKQIAPSADAARALLDQVPKRARLALVEILKKGFVTSKELQELGYNHPPRAIADLREFGVPIDTLTYVESATGRRLARYVLSPEQPIGSKFVGRKTYPKKFRELVFSQHEHRCAVCAQEYPPRFLQLDHRIPFRIAGEPKAPKPAEFQPLCAPHQRAKSFECESCPNWDARRKATCAACFWAHPDGDYKHVATRPERLLSIRWRGTETRAYERALRRFGGLEALSEWIKKAVAAIPHRTRSK